MVHILASHKQELENELQERIQAFFEANDETPASISVNMKMLHSESAENMPTIRIHIKDALSNTALNDDFVLTKTSDTTALLSA